MRARNAVDYDDMLLLGVALLTTSARARAKYSRMWSHVHVDEFQDTNTVQYEFLRLLTCDHRRACRGFSASRRPPP